MTLEGTIPSRALDVWRRLYTRYSLEPGPASVGPDVLKTIVPVTDADVLLRDPVTATATEDIQATIGTFVPYFTVPANRRWRIKNIFRFGTTGQCAFMISIDGVAILLKPTQTTPDSMSSIDFVLNPTDAIGLRTTGNAADSAIRADVFYEDEAAF